jgi:hypothetical protein
MSPQKTKSSEGNDSALGQPPALGEAYAMALDMLPPERRKVWASKISQPDESMVSRSQQPNRARTRPLARGAMRSSTNRLPLAR